MERTEHRSVAIDTYNRAQDLLHASPTPEQQDELLMLAFTSRYHWREAGGRQEWAISDWMVSRAAVSVGAVALAIHFAELAVSASSPDFPAWLRASLLEGLARAQHVAGNDELRDAALVRARLELAQEHDPEDAAIIEAQIAELL